MKKYSLSTIANKSKQHWKLLTAILSFLLFLFLGLVGFIVYIFDSQTVSQDPDYKDDSTITLDSAAILVKESDPVTLSRNGNEIDFDSETEVKVGDQIKTGENGIAYVIFSDNSSVTIDSNSEVQLDSFDSNNTQGLKIKVKQLFGRTWSRVENIFGKSELEVETPNTIAAVRGTEFGCDVISEDETKCYAIEHDISMLLKNSEYLDFIWTLKEGNWYRNTNEITGQIQTVEQLDPFIDDLALPDEFWTTFNKCLSKNIEGIDNSLIEYLNDNKLGCEEEKVEEAPAPPPAPQPLPAITGVNIAVPADAGSLTCTWSGTEAASYQVFVGTSPNSPDVYSWLDTTNTTHTFYNPNFASGFRYYCNALAINPTGISAVVSSGGYLHDRSAVTINDGTSSPWDDLDYYVSDNITLNGAFSGMNANQVQVRYTVRQSGSTPALYLDNSSNWTTTPNWFYGSFADMGAGNMRFVATPVLPNAVYMVFNYEIYSDHFGRSYRSQTSRSTYSY